MRIEDDLAEVDGELMLWLVAKFVKTISCRSCEYCELIRYSSISECCVRLRCEQRSLLTCGTASTVPTTNRLLLHLVLHSPEINHGLCLCLPNQPL